MSETEPQLRSIPRAPATPRLERSGRGLPIALGVALAVALGLLLWSRSQSSSRISDLEARNAALVDELAAREALVRAQEQRLADLRAGVHGLVRLLDQPLVSPPEKP